MYKMRSRYFTKLGIFEEKSFRYSFENLMQELIQNKAASLQLKETFYNTQKKESIKQSLDRLNPNCKESTRKLTRGGSFEAMQKYNFDYYNLTTALYCVTHLIHVFYNGKEKDDYTRSFDEDVLNNLNGILQAILLEYYQYYKAKNEDKKAIEAVPDQKMELTLK